MRGMLFVAAAIGLTGCVTQPPEPRSAQAEAEFQKLIAGKVAGDPISCLQTYRSGDMVRIDNSTVAFKDGRRVYVNHLIGECSGLGSGFRSALLSRTALSSTRHDAAGSTWDLVYVDSCSCVTFAWLATPRSCDCTSLSCA